MTIRRPIHILIISSLIFFLCDCITSTTTAEIIEGNSEDIQAQKVISSSPTKETPKPSSSEGEYKPHENEDPLRGLGGIAPESDPLELTDAEDGSEGEYIPHVQESPLTGEPGGESEKEIMITFTIPEEDQETVTPEVPPGTYQVTVNGDIFACGIWSGAPDRIYCIGPLVENNVMAHVTLENLVSGAILYEGKLSILIPEEGPVGNQPIACSGLDYPTCLSRSDCLWNLSKFPAVCEPK